MSNLLHDIGLEEEFEEATVSPPVVEAQGVEQLAPITARQDEAPRLQDAGTESGEAAAPLPQRIKSPPCENDGEKETAVRLDTNSKTENTSQHVAEMEQDTYVKEGTVVHSKITSEPQAMGQEIGIQGERRQDNAEIEQGTAAMDTNETHSNVRASTSPLHTEQKSAKEQAIAQSSCRTQAVEGSVIPKDDCREPSHDSVPVQKSCEQEKADKKTQKGTSESMKTEDKTAPSSHNRNARLESSSDQTQTGPNQRLQTLRESAFAETEFSVDTDPQPPPMIPTSSTIREGNQGFIPKAMQSQFRDGFQRHLAISTRCDCLDGSSSLPPIPSNHSEPQDQNPPRADNNQGRTPELPSQINNETTRYLPTSPIQGIGGIESPDNVELTETETPLQHSTLQCLSPSPQDRRSPNIREVLRAEENTEENSPPRNPVLPMSVEGLQTPGLSIYSNSPRLSSAERDDREEQGKKSSENKGDPCKPQGHHKKDDDGDDSDQQEYNTPNSVRITIGVSRKLSPSAKEEQPRKRRSFMGGELEEREILQDQREFKLRQAQTTATEKTDSNLTDEKEVLELTPSKTPDRPREHITPPGMPPLSRLQLPENCPEEPSPLGSGRRYQRKNMPSEYVPPRFNEDYDSQDASSSGEEDNSTDDNEDEDSESQDEGSSDRGIGEGVAVAESESRNEAHSPSTAAMEAPTSGPPRGVHARSSTLILPRRSFQILPTRNRNKFFGSEEGGYDSPEIEAWTESPKLPNRRTYRNQQIVHADNTMVYLVSPPTPRRSGAVQEFNRRVTGVLGNENVSELPRGTGIPRRMMPSEGTINSRFRARLNGTRNPRSTEPMTVTRIPYRASNQRLNGGRKPGSTERSNDGRKLSAMTRMRVARSFSVRDRFIGGNRNFAA